MEINGVVNLYKPSGITSQTAVNIVKRIFGVKKAGHCGTLDPQARGVMPIMLGNAVKASEYLVEHDKFYRASLALGFETDSEDTTGNVTKTFSGTLPNVTEIDKAVKSFEGSYMQVPPMYSALKIGGKKLVDLARDGKTVERSAREVFIYSAGAYEREGHIYLDVHCSKGTYIRTLCADLGRKLGCLACMDTLERTRVGMFDSDASHTLEELKQMDEIQLSQTLLSVEHVLDRFPKRTLQEFHATLIKNGCAVDVKKLGLSNDNIGEFFRLYDKNGFFGVGIIEQRDEINTLVQKKSFSS